MNTIKSAAFLDIDLIEQLKQAQLNGFMALPDMVVVSCVGEDASSFLQGQLTIDVLKKSEHASLASCCTPQGRMVGLFYLYQKDERTFWLMLPKSNSGNLLSHLKKYSIFSKVALTVEPLHLFAWIPYDITQQSTRTALLERNQSAQLVPLQPTKFHMIITNSENIDIPFEHYADLNSTHWDLAMLLQGIVQFNESMSGTYLPADLHIDELGGVSFNKGCYTGQEPIARMHYRGKPKFCCVLLHWQAPTHPVESDEVHLENAKIGTIVQSVLLGKDSVGIARVRIDALETLKKSKCYLKNQHCEAALLKCDYNEERYASLS